MRQGLTGHWGPVDKDARQFPPQSLRDYAFIADGERGVVVGPHGEFAWLCVPGWADDAVFSSLIGGQGGFSVTPVGDRYVPSGEYDAGSLIWRSRWVGTEGTLECRQALARPARPERCVILRRVEAVEGQHLVRVLLEPRAGYGREPFGDLRRHGEVWEGRTGDLSVRCSGLVEAVADDGSLVAELKLEAGQSRDLVVELTPSRFRSAPPDPATAWAETERGWAADVPPVDDPWAPRDVRQSLAVLVGLTSQYGGMVAAATTSLPERDAADRNYDYRYAWLRDMCLAGQALSAHGPHPLTRRMVEFVAERLLTDGAGVRPAYTVSGGPVPTTTTLDLPGYPGGVDHVGNGAGSQFQLDVLGECLLLFAAAERHDALPRSARMATEIAIGAIAERAGEPDSGIWEIEPRHWAHSRLICAAGLRAIASAGPGPHRQKWLAMADGLVKVVSRESKHPSGRWQRAPDDPAVDAALLLPVIRGAVPHRTEIAVRTVRAVLADLGEDHLLYRYRQGPGALGDTEGAFLMCSFSAAQALAVIDDQPSDRVEAARWFERSRAAAGSSGLFTEEYDPVTRQLRGNLPQAFVHAALIETATMLGRQR
jgi:alpha,alpha-trehalase